LTTSEVASGDAFFSAAELYPRAITTGTAFPRITTATADWSLHVGLVSV